MRQLSLFGAEAPPAAEGPAFQVEADLARRLPGHVRLGTSSWTFTGWQGLVYPTGLTPKRLRDEGLALYARNPLFSTVGVDRSYYAPLGEAEWADYARQLPEGFRCVVKAWGELTARVDPQTKAPNPSYLDRALFEEKVLGPLEPGLGGRLGALVLEFPPGRGSPALAPKDFVAGLDRFLGGLPAGLPAAVELRRREYLCDEYWQCLAARGAGHVFNYWAGMPPLGVQLRAAPGRLPGRLSVCRLLLPPGGDYEALRAAYAPFDRLHRPDPAMREGVRALAERCGREGLELFVLAGNKAEGSAPLTVRALAALLASAGAAPETRAPRGG
ncbi:MAG TPA: DUF72 domain-containing protein [Polyangiaceae bacterium]|nr:DUF72 domain-containing protein [Polyangiaceae bacterium]